jgi:dolichyl-phosphate beta-glucosyltransferase
VTRAQARAVSPVRWSVVIPAYNEAERLPPYLDRIVAYLGGRREPYEVLVVDDGSRDATSEVARALGRHHPEVKALRRETNQGKGAAVRRGMLAAAGELRLFADADGATPIGELARLERALEAGADVAIGSRALGDPGVAVVTRRHRALAGQVFNRLVRRLGLTGIADSQCGFKAFRAAVAEDLFGRLRTMGFGFDVEILLRARAAGYRIVEVPVNWVDQAGSKVAVLTDGPRMVWQIVLARARLGAGR